MPSGATGDCGSRPSDRGDLAWWARAWMSRAVEQHRARLRLQQPGQAAQQGRLAAGVGPDDRRDRRRWGTYRLRLSTTVRPS